MYGTQTIPFHRNIYYAFENDVKMYGTQTKEYVFASCLSFENDVKMYGTQTLSAIMHKVHCLRMM